MQIAQALGDASEEGSSSALGLLEPLGEAGSVVAAGDMLGIVTEALQSTIAHIVAPVRATLNAVPPFFAAHIVFSSPSFSRFHTVSVHRLGTVPKLGCSDVREQPHRHLCVLQQ